MQAHAEVIIAIASPAGRSVRGIIRFSGQGTFDVLGLLAPEFQRSRGLAFVRLALDQHEIPSTLLIMPAPHSYTGEDCAELQLPGNPVLLERIVELFLTRARQDNIAARRANPGEFTARAFLNGRVSLTQAEGVASIISAQSDAELRAARLLTGGSLGDFAHALADELANALALVEAGIDFTDQDDVVAIAPGELHERLSRLRQRIEEHLRKSVGMEQLQAIPWVVLVGEPNAGKSALFNALLGHERAVVSPVSGTTRDVLVEPLKIATSHGEAEVMLVDLAGLDEQQETMNQLMQSAAKHAVERAELVLRCVPVDAVALPEVLRDEMLVVTKSDLSSSDLENAVAAEDGMHVSAFTGAGMDQLRSEIARQLAGRTVSLAADTLALQPRHEAALRSAAANLRESIDLAQPLKNDRALAYPELIASTMRAALNDLAALAGDITPDEVLGRVFATFCVGK